jgi:hypothetical protein
MFTDEDGGRGYTPFESDVDSVEVIQIKLRPRHGVRRRGRGELTFGSTNRKYFKRKVKSFTLTTAEVCAFEPHHHALC